MQFYLEDEIKDLSKYISENYPGMSLSYEMHYNHRLGREEYLVSINKDGTVWKYSSFYLSNRDMENQALTPWIDLKGHFQEMFRRALDES